MYKILYIALCIILSSTAFACDECSEIVYLKSGSEIHGTILEYVSNEGLKFQTVEGSIVALSWSDISNIDRKIIQQKGGRKTSGIKMEIRLGILSADRKVEDNSIWGCNIIVGKQFYYVSVGLGIGYEGYLARPAFPIYLDLKLYPISSAFGPFIYGKAGRSYMLIKHYSGFDGGKTMFAVGGGMKFATNTVNSVSIALGVRWQEFKQIPFPQYRTDYSFRSSNSNFEFITLSFGLHF